MAGYAGKIAFVDLTSGLVTKESLPEQVYRRSIGGAGLGAKILYDKMKAGIDPLGLSAVKCADYPTKPILTS